MRESKEIINLWLVAQFYAPCALLKLQSSICVVTLWELLFSKRLNDFLITASVPTHRVASTCLHSYTISSNLQGSLRIRPTHTAVHFLHTRLRFIIIYIFCESISLWIERLIEAKAAHDAHLVSISRVKPKCTAQEYFFYIHLLRTLAKKVGITWEKN